MFEPLLTPLLSSLFSPLIAAAKRIFITVNGVDEYFTFQNTKTFPNDFDLSIDAVLPTTATTVTLFGQVASADHYIKVLSTGFVSINIDTSIVTSTVLATKDSKQRRYGVRVVGDDFIFTEDGATIDTVTDAVAAAKTLVINALCQSNGGDFFNRTPSDPILTDLTTASNSVSWQLNRALPATTEQSTDGTNLLTYVGAPITELFTFNQSEQRWVEGDIVVNGGFDTDTDWTKQGTWAISSGVASATLENGFIFGIPTPVITGSTYLAEFEITTILAGGVRTRAGGAGVSGATHTTVGVFSDILIANGDSYIVDGQGFTGSVNYVSFKRIIQIA